MKYVLVFALFVSKINFHVRINIEEEKKKTKPSPKKQE